MKYVSLLEDVVGPRPHPQELDLPLPKEKTLPSPSGGRFQIAASSPPPPPPPPNGNDEFREKPLRPTWTGWGGGEDEPPPGFHGTQHKPWKVTENTRGPSMSPLDMLYMEVGLLKESRFSGGTELGRCTDCALKAPVKKPCAACGTDTVRPYDEKKKQYKNPMDGNTPEL